MSLSDKAIQEFREILTREFKREFSEEEARSKATSFMRLLLFLLRPLPLSRDVEREHMGNQQGRVDDNVSLDTM